MTTCSVAHVWRTTTAPNVRKCENCGTVQIRTPRGMWVEGCGTPVVRPPKPVVDTPDLWMEGKPHE